MDGEMRWPADWMRGVLELCVLAAVTEQASHGYAVAARLAGQGLGVIKGGTLYPLLARLEAEGLVASCWQAGDGGPGRKVFSVTTRGRRELARRAALWQDFASVTSQLFHPFTPDRPSILEP
jgi:PadR family transcriptional regulator PadR